MDTQKIKGFVLHGTDNELCISFFDENNKRILVDETGDDKIYLGQMYPASWPGIHSLIRFLTGRSFVKVSDGSGITRFESV